MPIVIKEVSIDWLTVTLKYDNHGGGTMLYQGIMVEVQARLCCVSINWA